MDSRVALVALLALSSLVAACGGNEGIVIFVRDDENQPVPLVQFLLVGGGTEPLGQTDAGGQATIRPARKKGETLRVRCHLPDEIAGAGYRFEDPVTLTEADFARGSRLVRFERARVDTTSVAALWLETDPPGAQVFIEDTDQGRSPVFVRDLAPGRVQVLLRLEGYEDERFDLFLDKGDGNRTTWMLRRKGEAIATQAPPPRRLPADDAGSGAAGVGPGGAGAAGAAGDAGRVEEVLRASSNGDGGAPAAPVERASVSAPADAGGASDPAAGEPRARPAAPAAPQVDAREVAIRGVLRDYVHALEALDVAGYAGLWVDLSDQARRRIEQGFKDLDSQSITVEGERIDIDGAEAVAQFTQRRTLKLKAGSDMSDQRQIRMKLRRGADGRWRIDQLE
jgi:hypothetical protein